MRPGNDTRISKFLLLQLTEKPELQHFIFAHFLSMYQITVLINMFIIMVTITDYHTTNPCNSSYPICSFKISFTFTTIPKKAKP